MRVLHQHPCSSQHVLLASQYQVGRERVRIAPRNVFTGVIPHLEDFLCLERIHVSDAANGDERLFLVVHVGEYPPPALPDVAHRWMVGHLQVVDALGQLREKQLAEVARKRTSLVVMCRLACSVLRHASSCTARHSRGVLGGSTVVAIDCALGAGPAEGPGFPPFQWALAYLAYLRVVQVVCHGWFISLCFMRVRDFDKLQRWNRYSKA